MVSMIWAEDNQHGIGKNNDVPWDLPDDMQYFKDTTSGAVIVMGKRTFESLGSQALPNRINLVLTSDTSYQVSDPAVRVIHYPQEAIEISESENKTLYVSGGSSVYRSFMDFADELLVTRVNGSFGADTFVDPIDMNNFYLFHSLEHPTDGKHAVNFKFETYKRKIVSDKINS